MALSRTTAEGTRHRRVPSARDQRPGSTRQLLLEEIAVRGSASSCGAHPKTWELLRLTRMPAVHLDLDLGRAGVQGVAPGDVEPERVERAAHARGAPGHEELHRVPGLGVPAGAGPGGVPGRVEFVLLAGQRHGLHNTDAVFRHYAGPLLGPAFGWYAVVVLYSIYVVMLSGAGAVLRTDRYQRLRHHDSEPGLVLGRQQFWPARRRHHHPAQQPGPHRHRQQLADDLPRE